MFTITKSGLGPNILKVHIANAKLTFSIWPLSLSPNFGTEMTPQGETLSSYLKISKVPPHPTHPHPFSLREYLPNPTDYLKKNVLPMGYKTCHVLNSSLDATICAKDCERLKKQKFGNDCKKKGGFFKCCIRRDKAFCNECRYIFSQVEKKKKRSNAQVLLHTPHVLLSPRNVSTTH